MLHKVPFPEKTPQQSAVKANFTCISTSGKLMPRYKVLLISVFAGANRYHQWLEWWNGKTVRSPADTKRFLAIKLSIKSAGLEIYLSRSHIWQVVAELIFAKVQCSQDQ
ncbi:hypothetical protein SLE2022_132610 [Rubroshorea leprosula]